MKRINVTALTGLLIIMITSGASGLRAQDPAGERARELDLKMQLLDTKLALLDSKISLWETKPEELDMKMQEIDTRIRKLDFDPDEFNARMEEMKAGILEVKNMAGRAAPQVPDFRVTGQEYQPVFRSAIMLNPVRLFEGTFQISYERVLTDRFSGSASLLATYATQEGLTNYFFENQVFSYYDAAIHSYKNYSGESIAGGGIILEGKNYLLADFPMHRKAPMGLYAAPQVLFRKLYISGTDHVWADSTWVTQEVKQRLNVLSTGVLIGYKLPVAKVIVLDFFVGGHIRLSKYDGKAGLTKFKDWYNIDFSGVFPTAGIAVGILK